MGLIRNGDSGLVHFAEAGLSLAETSLRGVLIALKLCFQVVPSRRQSLLKSRHFTLLRAAFAAFLMEKRARNTRKKHGCIVCFARAALWRHGRVCLVVWAAKCPAAISAQGRAAVAGGIAARTRGGGVAAAAAQPLPQRHRLCPVFGYLADAAVVLVRQFLLFAEGLAAAALSLCRAFHAGCRAVAGTGRGLCGGQYALRAARGRIGVVV